MQKARQEHLSGLNYYADLLCAEDAVACVAEAGNDVAVFIEMIVESGNIDIDIGVILLHALNAFGSTDDAHELDMLHAVVLEELDRCGSRSAVASMGSTTITSLSSISGGILK